MKKESRFKKMVMALLCLTPAWGLALVFVGMVYVTQAQILYQTEARLGDRSVPITVMTGKRIMLPGAVLGLRELSMQNGKVVYLHISVSRCGLLLNKYVDATPAESELFRKIFSS